MAHRNTAPRLPRLVRFMAVNGAIGFAIAAVFVLALLAADPGDARKLLLHAAGHWWPALLLWIFLGLTFGSVQIAVATMLLAETPDRPAGGYGVRHRLVPIPVRVDRTR